MSRDDELLTAYLDGVAELDAADRARVEARLRDDAALRGDADATRALLGRLRELPPEGVEPDWAQLARQISDAVGPLATTPWWRNWRWIVPIGALAATAAAALLWLGDRGLRPAPEAPVQQAMPVVHDAAAPTVAPSPSLLWLDGEAIDVGDLDPAQVLLDDLDADPVADTGQPTSGGILPASDLGWIDSLDDRAIARAETWLARKSL